MSYILHIESGLKFDIEGKTASDVQSEIKDAGLLIDNITIRRMLDGVLQSANGFELIDSLSQEEQEETLEALDRAKAEEVQPTGAAGVKEGAGDTTAVIDAEETVDQPEAEQTANSEESTETAEQADPQKVEAVANADEVRRRILGTNVAEALAEGSNAAEDASLAAKSKLTNLTPAVAPEDRKRRHNKREEMVEAARSSNFGAILAAVEAGVIPGVYLSYVNPDMRWFQFPVTDLTDKENPHARTNTYVDLAPITSGGWGFSLYVKGKSFTKRQKIKETDAESLVKAINEWLPGALEEAKNAG